MFNHEKRKKTNQFKVDGAGCCVSMYIFFVLVFIGFEVQKDFIPNSVPLMQGHDQAIGLQKHE